MGSLGDNGGNWPGDGGAADGLPGLPEEWGVIVVPDDLSQLTAEVTAIQAELRRDHHPTRWDRFAERPMVRALRRLGSAGLRAPVLIISLAVLVTIASLFASTWPGPSRPPSTQRTANVTDDTLETLPALELRGSEGQMVALNGQLPAVILITDQCECGDLVAATTSAVRADTTVVTVVSGPGPAATAPVPPTSTTPQAQGKTIRAMRDPTGGLRASLKLGAPDGTAAVLLVNRSGDIVRKIPRTASVSDFQPDLARL